MNSTLKRLIDLLSISDLKYFKFKYKTPATPIGVYNFVIKSNKQDSIVAYLKNLSSRIEIKSNDKLYLFGVNDKINQIYDGFINKKYIKLEYFSHTTFIKFIHDIVQIEVYIKVLYNNNLILSRIYKYNFNEINNISYISFLVNNLGELLLNIEFYNISYTPKKLPHTYEYIQGPVSSYYLEHPIFPFKILLFGDYHFYSNNSCPNSITIDKWIEEYLKSDIPVELYIEAQYNHDDIVLNNSDYISNVISIIYKNCPNIKYKCNYNNSKVHNMDIRWFSDVYYHLRVMNHYIVEGYNADNNELSLFYYRLSLEIMYDLIIQYHMYDFTSSDTLYDLIIKPKIENKILKQCKHIPDSLSDIKDFLLQEYNEYIFLIKNYQINDSLKIRLNIMIDNMKKYTNYQDFENSISISDYQIYTRNIKDYYDYLLDINSSLVDYYLLGRLFRKYTEEIKIYNNIIYLGDFHILNIKRLLLKLNFSIKNSNYQDDLVIHNISVSELIKLNEIDMIKEVKDFKIKNSTQLNQCIDIRNFKQPLFV